MADNRPHLAAAFVCERVLQEKDEVLSAIRIVDTLWVSRPPEDLPVETTPAIQVTILLSFKKTGPGPAERHELTLQLIPPSGPAAQKQTAPLLFPESDIGGANLIANMMVPIKQLGLFWLDVSLDGEPVTRVPFRVLEKPQESAKMIH